LETGFLKDRLYLTVNWYRNISDNQIIRYSLPDQTGFTSVLRNFPGVVENSGMEFSLEGTIIKNQKASWNLSINISLNRNKLLSFPGLANSSYSENYVVDKPLNTFRGLHYTGIEALTGIYQFDDINKDGIIDNNDFRWIGTTDPVYFGGFSNTIRLGSFELNLLLEFRKQKGPHTVYSSGIAAGDIINQPAEVLDRWQMPGDIKKFEKFTQDFTNPAYNPAIYNMASSDAALTDASFIRVKNISLSYNFPSGLIRKLKMESWRIYLQGRNIATITRYKGYDPETRSGSSLPPLYQITAGMQIAF
ncbi:MAG TPA: TonB-dependent receptor, partial [Puia sp.]